MATLRDTRRAIVLDMLPDDRKYRASLEILPDDDLHVAPFIPPGISELDFVEHNIMSLPDRLPKCNLIFLCDIMVDEHVGSGLTLAYLNLDRVITHHGILISMHFATDYSARLPYLMMERELQELSGKTHITEVYLNAS